MKNKTLEDFFNASRTHSTNLFLSFILQLLDLFKNTRTGHRIQYTSVYIQHGAKPEIIEKLYFFDLKLLKQCFPFEFFLPQTKNLEKKCRSDDYPQRVRH